MMGMIDFLDMIISSFFFWQDLQDLLDFLVAFNPFQKKGLKPIRLSAEKTA